MDKDFVVVGGLLPIVNSNKNGLAPKGFYDRFIVRDLGVGETYTFGPVHGFVAIKNNMSWGGFCLYWVSYEKVTVLSQTPWGTNPTLSISASNKKCSLTNDNSALRTFFIYYQSLDYTF